MNAASGEESPASQEVAAGIVLRDGRVLVQCRPEGRSWAGYWEFPGGKRERGETAFGCAERELAEEVGLVVRARGTLCVEEWVRRDVRLRIVFVLCTLDDASGELPATGPEGQALAWVDGAQLARLRCLPANGPVVARLRQRLAGA